MSETPGLTEVSFAEELRQRARRKIICFLRVEKPFYVFLNGTALNQVALFEGMTLAVVGQTEEYLVADYYGSVIEIGDIRPAFFPDYHLELRISVAHLEDKVQLVAESNVAAPDRRVTAVIREIKTPTIPPAKKIQ